MHLHRIFSFDISCIVEYNTLFAKRPHFRAYDALLILNARISLGAQDTRRKITVLGDR